MMGSKYLLSAVAALALLAGCAGVDPQSRYEPDGERTADGTYRRVMMNFSGRGGTEFSVPVYWKPVNEGGWLALCGYFVRTGNQYQDEWARRGLTHPESKILLNGEGIGNLSFLRQNAAGDTTASCFRTKSAWSPAYPAAVVMMRSPQIKWNEQ